MLCSEPALERHIGEVVGFVVWMKMRGAIVGKKVRKKR
jgi:hypothetical protein